MNPSSVWPELSIAQWKETSATVHMWTQIIGKTSGDLYLTGGFGPVRVSQSANR